MTTRRICFTLNNPTQDLETWVDKFYEDEHPRYVIVQKEEGEQGTPHFQGYAEFSAPLRWASIASKYHMHVETAKGKEADNTHYCSKPVEGCTCKHCVPPPTRLDGPVVRGSTSSSGRGARTDLHAARDALREGGIKRVADEHLEVFLKYSKAFRELDTLEEPSRSVVTVTLYFGPPGAGKTYAARRVHTPSWTTPPGWSGQSFWFDGLRRDHAALVIDEFKGQVPLDTLLKLLNADAQLVPIKGSHTWLVCPFVYITTNIHPYYWYDWTGREMQYAALTRRINMVYGFRGYQKSVLERERFFGWRRPVVGPGDEYLVQDEYELIPPMVPEIFRAVEEAMEEQ